MYQHAGCTEKKVPPLIEIFVCPY